MPDESAERVDAPVNAPVDLLQWVEGVAALTRPDAIQWCDGSTAERDRMTASLVESGAFIALNDELRPGCFLGRPVPVDAADAEARTFICSERPEDAGPTNRWVEPAEMKQRLALLFDGSMRGRTMYVVPFSMGPANGAMNRYGVEITDSPYVVVAMRLIARIGASALDAIAEGQYWVPTVHSVGYPLRDADDATRSDVPWPGNDEAACVAFFPETREIWSYGFGHGSNAVLAGECFALRLASTIARDEGWLAERMRVLKATSPDGRVRHVATMLPFASVADSFATAHVDGMGWRTEPVGCDIAWLRPGGDGRLYAANPQAGVADVAVGLSSKTNPERLRLLGHDTIFLNVALTDDGDVWWEGMTDEPPAHLLDWQGNDWTPDSDAPAAHPQAQFVTSTLGGADEPGVAIDAIVYDGCQTAAIPLVIEAYSWEQGVFTGALVAAEQASPPDGAADEETPSDDAPVLLPSCGYNMGDYWAHWLRLGRALGVGAPHIFGVNLSRKTDDGKLLWPGQAGNMRLLDWIMRCAADEVSGANTLCGRVPYVSDLHIEGLGVAPEQVDALFAIDTETWTAEADASDAYFDSFGTRLPAEFTLELADLRGRIAAQKAAGGGTELPQRPGELAGMGVG